MASYLPHTQGKPSMEVIIDRIACLTHELTFGSVVVSGFSGVIPGAIFCHMYDKNLVVVRKESDKHHGQCIEGSDGWQEEPCILLDDFVDSGQTVYYMMKKVMPLLKFKPVGVVLYNNYDSTLIERTGFTLKRVFEGLYSVEHTEVPFLL